MRITITFILVGLIDVSTSQWPPITKYQYEQQKFTYNNGSYDYSYQGDFSLPPPISYITLSRTYPTAEGYSTRKIKVQSVFMYCKDLYYSTINRWRSGIILGVFIYSYTIPSLTNYLMIDGFLDDETLYSQYLTQDFNTLAHDPEYYDANVVKFSQEESLINQYYDKNFNRCLDCLISSLSCTSKIDCQTCQSTYTKTKLGCVCKQNQYEDSNRCFDCPIEQHQQCLVINDMENVGSTCRCPTGLFYNAVTNSCSQCHSSCQTCFQGSDSLTCDSSLNRILKGVNCACAPGYYEQNNECSNCPVIEDIELSSCYKLCNNNEQLWNRNICNSCDSGLDLSSGECQPIFGDLQIIGYEQCDDNNCYQSTSLSFPDICGDGMITGIEKCGDGNTIQYDGCFNCKFQCQPSCSKCIKGECFECNTGGWETDLTVQPWKCKERCGDRQIVGKEQCDDGNTNSNDGCNYYCEFDCQPSSIYLTCVNEKCHTCASGQLLSDTQLCIAICGDSIKQPYKKCVDGFILSYKGCQNCKLNCQSSCSQCDNYGKGCLTCINGYKIIDYLCYSICGDNIVTEDEECDDGNLIFGDGCHQCYFSCSLSCSNCHKGVCYDCHEGYQYLNYSCFKINNYQLDPRCSTSCVSCSTFGQGCLVCENGFENIHNTCFSICGDQITTKYDDGNLIFQDGCHTCSQTCTYSEYFKNACFSCQNNHFLYKNQCFRLEENISFKGTSNFLFSDLSITQAFQVEMDQTNKIQIQIIEFVQSIYNQDGQFIEIMIQGFSSLTIEINFACLQNKKVKNQFFKSCYQKGSKNQAKIFLYNCHNTLNHITTFSFRLEKRASRDEIIVIKISENEFKLSTLFFNFVKNEVNYFQTIFQQSPQRLLYITYDDIP